MPKITAEPREQTNQLDGATLAPAALQPPTTPPIIPPPTNSTTPGWLRPLLAPLRIITKEGDLVRLGDVWNHAQLEFIDEVERQIVHRGQVRIIVLKARQIGISTIIEAILFLFAVMNDDFSSQVIAHEKDASQHLLSMSNRYWETYIHKRHHKARYQGKAHLAWTNGSGMIVKTAKNEESGRSNTTHALHASEVAFWPVPDKIMTAIKPSIPKFGLTFIFLESTANGIGNYFHTMCVKAMKGANEYKFMFFPWHTHPEYTAAYIPLEERQRYALDDSELSEEEQWLRDVMKIDDARLIWRRYMIANEFNGDLNKFHQEYPTTPHEAFVSTGLNVFPLADCLNHYRPRRGAVGVLVRNPATKQIEFQRRSDGWLTVYSYPSADKSWGVYLEGGDPTHTLAGDNAVIQVLNRRTLEQVAVYRNKIDPVRFGKHAQLIGHWYHDALAAIEREGPGYATVGCMLADDYPNVYQGSNVVSAQGKPTDAMGWSTNVQTKDLAISHLLKHITEPLVEVGGNTYGLVIHDELTLMELRDYVTADGKKFTNGDGSEYDDGVMSLAIAVTVHDFEPPPPPYQSPSPIAGRPNVTNVDRSPIPAQLAAARQQAPRDDDDSDPEPPPMPPWEAWSATRHEGW